MNMIWYPCLYQKFVFSVVKHECSEENDEDDDDMMKLNTVETGDDINKHNLL